MTKTRDLADLGGGFIQAGTGAVQRTVESKLQDVVSVKDFGAVGDGVTDDTAAIQAALNAAASSKATLFIPSGYYLVTSGLTFPSYTPHAGRGCGVRIVGQGYYSSIIKFTAAAYLLTGAGDYISISGIQVDTTTGGFLNTTGHCGGLHIDHFFMNGCGADYYFLETAAGSTDLYTANITDSRFWRETGYYGGVLWMRDSGINVAFRNSFISQQRRDGGIFRINNCDGFLADNCQFEGAEATTTNQNIIELTGFNFNVTISNCYFEGKWDKGVAQLSGATRGLRLIANKFWEYTGKPSPVALDLSAGVYSGVVVDGLTYINNDTGAGSGYIIDDPTNAVTISNLFNNSSGNQAAREWSQTYPRNENRGYTALAYVASGNPITYNVQLPAIEGEYEATVTFNTQDNNHAVNARYRVLYSSGQTYNYATTDIIGSIKGKGTAYPTGLTCSVTTGGLITFSATAAQSGSPSVYWYWRRLGSMT